MISALDELYVGIQNIVSTASGVPLDHTILADQGREPPEPGSDRYATYLPVPVRAVGHPRTDRELVSATEPFNESLLGADWEDFESTTVTQLDMMISCNFVNGDARDAAWRMHNANFRWPVLQLLRQYGIGWRNCSEVRRLTAIDQAGYQPRYQVDVNVYVQTQITDSVLRAAGVTIEVEDEAGNTLIQGAA